MKNAIAPTHASKTFLIKMFLVFLDLTDPAHNIANPACIKNTRYADDNKNWLSEEPVMVAIPDNTLQRSSVYINRVKRERRERRQELVGQYYIIILCVTFFFSTPPKNNKMSVPREELLFLVQQNGGDFSKVRKFFDEFVQGNSLFLSLSLSLWFLLSLFIKLISSR